MSIKEQFVFFPESYFKQDISDNPNFNDNNNNRILPFIQYRAN